MMYFVFSRVNADGSRQVRIQPNSVERFFLTLNEDSGGGTLNLAVPWRTLRFKAGGLTQYSARQFDGRRFFVMDFVDGCNLHDLVKKLGPLAPDVAALNYAPTRRSQGRINMLGACLGFVHGTDADLDAGCVNAEFLQDVDHHVCRKMLRQQRPGSREQRGTNGLLVGAHAILNRRRLVDPRRR